MTTCISTNSNSIQRPMEKKSKSKSFLSSLEQSIQAGSIPSKYGAIIEKFYLCYQEATSTKEEKTSDHDAVFLTLLQLIEQQCKTPFDFQPYHAMIRTPFDYYQFGLDLVKPLVDLPRSTIHGLDSLKQIAAALEKRDNVIFFANHQTEADPQA